MDNIKESVSQMQQLFTRQMDAFQSQLVKSSSPSTIVTLTADFVAFKTFVLAALQTLQDQVQCISRSLDNMEMQSRKKILLFHGLPEGQLDVTASIVHTVVNQLKLTDFSANSISRCHRMGRADTPNKTRPILVKIRDLSLRNKIWSAKASLKGSGVTLSEFLTKARHDIFMTARQKFGVTKTWSREGVVFVLGPDGVRHRVICASDLDKIGGPSASKSPKQQVPEVVKDVVTKTRRAAGTSRK